MLLNIVHMKTARLYIYVNIYICIFVCISVSVPLLYLLIKTVYFYLTCCAKSRLGDLGGWRLNREVGALTDAID